MVENCLEKVHMMWTCTSFSHDLLTPLVTLKDVIQSIIAIAYFASKSSSVESNFPISCLILMLVNSFSRISKVESMISIAPGLLLCLFFIIVHVSYGNDTLVANQYLSGNQTIVSHAGKFEMGFFRPGKSPNYYIGIWYHKMKISYETIVWVANRETPIFDKFSSKLIIKDGNLVLLNELNTKVWSTNITSSSTASSSVSVLLLDDGNLVLKYGSSSSPPIWQSVDHPTHAYVPPNKFGYNKRTNIKHVTTSWKSREDPAAGLFSFMVDQNEKQLVLKWNNSVQYWNSGPWDGQVFSLLPAMRFNKFYKFSYIDNENESYFTCYPYKSSIISILTIDITGQIQQLTRQEGVQQWKLFWTKPQEICQVYAYCGAFGVCSLKSLPFCSCLDAFKPTLQSDWNAGDFSGGCVRKTELNCRVREEKTYGYIVSHVPVKFLSSSLENKILSLDDESACKRSCLDDCTCEAYSFTFKTCRFWNGDNLNNISHVFLSDDSVAEKLEVNIKVSSKDVSRRQDKKKFNLGAVAGSLAGVALVLGLIFLIICSKKRVFLGKTTMEGSLVAFVYKDLKIATKNFSDKLGGGGFGSVFKGVLHDSSIVAVKKLESISQGDKQFRNEVSTIGIIQHVHLVRLRGFCAQGNEKLLVYEYMPNGSLHSHLFHHKQDGIINWETRYQIALGTARGLVYLHEKCRDCIIHCDIKPENILLDADFCPKIADFGLAKLMCRDFSKVLTTMRGTRGYLAPEWLSGVAVTAKADVFSYGMLLFELVHGRRNAELSEDSSFTFFPSLATNVVMAGGDILSLVDSRLNREASVEEVTKVFKVAYWCIQDEEDSRPSMSQVEQILEGVLDVNMPPIPQSIKYFVDNMEHDVFYTESSSITWSSQVQRDCMSGDSQ